jgi:hypothetical protein
MFLASSSNDGFFSVILMPFFQELSTIAVLPLARQRAVNQQRVLEKRPQNKTPTASQPG